MTLYLTFYKKGLKIRGSFHFRNVEQVFQKNDLELQINFKVKLKRIFSLSELRILVPFQKWPHKDLKVTVKAMDEVKPQVKYEFKFN